VMDQGRIVEAGASADVWRAPRHPYTRSLMRSVLRIDAPPDWDALAAEADAADPLPGQLPNAAITHRGGVHP
jgi:peptide/nickel transport system ATP-binding protein